MPSTTKNGGEAAIVTMSLVVVVLVVLSIITASSGTNTAKLVDRNADIEVEADKAFRCYLTAREKAGTATPGIEILDKCYVNYDNLVEASNLKGR